MSMLRRTFGRKAPTVAEMKEAVRPAPDSDGVTRVFSKTLWEDPEIGAFLRSVGRNPDDANNRVRTAEEHLARFTAARERLERRAAEFNRDLAARFGHCQARPFLIIAPEIWDGPHGAFLYGQLDICGYDEWNVLMCAADQETIDRCDLVGHPGTIPALTEKVTEGILRYKARYHHALDAFGETVLGRPGIDSAEFERIVDEIRRELIDYIAFCRGKVIEILSRPPA
ncbi:MAG: hypothetical protein ACXW2T_01875 [Allosphingosinicella sp.]